MIFGIEQMDYERSDFPMGDLCGVWNMDTFNSQINIQREPFNFNQWWKVGGIAYVKGYVNTIWSKPKFIMVIRSARSRL